MTISDLVAIHTEMVEKRNELIEGLKEFIGNRTIKFKREAYIFYDGYLQEVMPTRAVKVENNEIHVETQLSDGASWCWHSHDDDGDTDISALLLNLEESTKKKKP